MPDGLRPPALPYGVRDMGDAWAFGPNGEKFWGRYGAAGLLVWHRPSGVLMQHRVGWSHFGGTWGIPGGARKHNETAQAAALREAHEEAGVPGELLSVLFTDVFDLGFWSYTTVTAEAVEIFLPVIGDAESEDLRWVPVEQVESLPLHPGFAASWPTLRQRLRLRLRD